MRLALISDIHGNLPALISVLEAIKRHSPDQIISLGDQVNLGPCPREVLSLLGAQGVTCLHGNHERYILSVMDGDPAYAGSNFNSLRFHAGILSPEEITFPKELRIGDALFTHAMPGDDRFPVFHVKQCMERLSGMEFPVRTHIFCGHGHNPKQYQYGNLTLNVIGSVGCMDDGVPGTAPYAILDMEPEGMTLQPYFAQYDVRIMPSLFRESGMADYCPVMAHIACLQAMTNKEHLLSFVALANRISKGKGETVVSEASWHEADASYPWPDGIGTAQFFKMV